MIKPYYSTNDIILNKTTDYVTMLMVQSMQYELKSWNIQKSSCIILALEEREWEQLSIFVSYYLFSYKKNEIFILNFG